MARIGSLRLLTLAATLCALGLSGVAFAAAPPPDQRPRPSLNDEPQVVRIAVTNKGLDAKALEVKLEQGRPVELKFEYQETINDNHTFELEGYGLQTEALNPGHREVSLKFVPTQLGPVVFYCILDCEIHHYLQDQKLTVVPPGGGGTGAAVAERPTSLTLASLQQASKGEAVTVWATLRDADGKPITGAPVRFFVATQLFPDKPTAVGNAATDAQGQAKFSYTPRADGKFTLQAKFEGGGIYSTSDASYSLEASNAQPAYLEKPKGLEAISHWAPTVVRLVLLGIWSTYAFVVYQIVRIGLAKRKAA